MSGKVYSGLPFTSADWAQAKDDLKKMWNNHTSSYPFEGLVALMQLAFMDSMENAGKIPWSTKGGNESKFLDILSKVEGKSSEEFPKVAEQNKKMY